MLGFHTITDLREQAGLLRAARFGVIEVANDRLVSIRVRPYPKSVSMLEILSWGRWSHERRPGNRCRLFYNEPNAGTGYLTLKYVVSTRDTSYRTFRGALAVLDEIAKLKKAAATVCEVTNLRISDRFLARMGWERHCLQSRRRHFIKRYYGTYPPSKAAYALTC